jgi:hypothetical protein
LIITPAAQYTVDGTHVEGTNFDQPKWARSRSSFEEPLTTMVHIVGSARMREPLVTQRVPFRFVKHTVRLHVGPGVLEYR